MSIKITNTLTREKEEFKPIKEGHAGIYSCGPTVYNYAHLGNLRAYIFADTLKRMFLLNKYKVNHVINITDVGHLSDDADTGEDKMMKGAKREGKTVWDIARFYEEAFKEDMKLLNILSPTTYSRATEHIEEMISLNKKIESNGFTYIAEGNLYFDTSKYKDYWQLWGTQPSEEDMQGRVEKDPHKKNQADFVLWFTRHKYEDHAMEWDSPWGRGFPGWHIECSAMSSKYLGEEFDIHTGGVDHIQIHHTNEIAQAECGFGHKWVHYWMHNEFLVIKDSEKMAKSKGNFLRLQSIIDKDYSPLDYRYFILGTHYRKKVMFSFEALDSARNAMSKLKNKILVLRKDSIGDIDNKIVDETKSKIVEDVSDDLNTPKVLATLWDLIGSETSAKTKLETLQYFDDALGLKLNDIKEESIPQEILELKEQRDKARDNKDWKKSDEFRDLLKEKGYQALDSKEGTELRKI